MSRSPHFFRLAFRSTGLVLALALPWSQAVAADVKAAADALAKKDWATAAKLASEVIATSPKSAEAFRIRGMAKNRLKDYEGALADFSSALKLEPGDVESVLGQGRSHRLLKQYDASVADFTRAHELAPKTARPLCERGAILILQEKWDASLADYIAAEKVDPTYPGLYSYFAEIYLYMRRPADALAATRKGLTHEPDALIHQVNLAHSNLFLGNYAEAKALYVALQDRLDEGKGIPGRAVVETDFSLLRAAGITHPDMPKIEAAIGLKPAAKS